MTDFNAKITSNMHSTAHTLIGGCTGSGKSVLINSFIGYAYQAYKGDRFIFIDPKRVELIKYKGTRPCFLYASENADIINAFKKAIDLMESIYREMQARGLNESDKGHLYIIVDELADLMTQKDVRTVIFPMLQRIAQLGRAAHIHLICATQAPSRKVIPAELTLNFTMRIALRCATAIESKQVLNGFDGAEMLPKYGECLINLDGRLFKGGISLPPADELSKLIKLNQYAHNTIPPAQAEPVKRLTDEERTRLQKEARNLERPKWLKNPFNWVGLAIWSGVAFLTIKALFWLISIQI